MKHLLFILAISLGISTQAQTKHIPGDHYPVYKFKFESGFPSPELAKKAEKSLLELKDLVYSAKVDALTGWTMVEVADIKIDFMAIYDHLIFQGFRPSKDFTIVETEH